MGASLISGGDYMDILKWPVGEGVMKEGLGKEESVGTI